MDDIFDKLNSVFETGERLVATQDKNFQDINARLDDYLKRAKETLQQKLAINPKPQKRLMRIVDDDEEEIPTTTAFVPIQRESMDKSFRPSRTAKTKATQQLKEVPLSGKMRNENNTVIIKMERTSKASDESLKENRQPEEKTDNSKKRRSPDEGIQSASETDSASAKDCRRTDDSVEVITSKPVEINVSSGDDADRMPPPIFPTKKAVKTRTKQKQKPKDADGSEDIVQGGPLRVTRSKIKKEKESIDTAAPEPAISKVDSSAASESTIAKINETTTSKKGKKKCPMPILIKIENISGEATVFEKAIESDPQTQMVVEKNEPVAAKENEPLPKPCDETFNVPTIQNETVTITANNNSQMLMNETVTIGANPDATDTTEKANTQDSLMTEDNDEEDEPLKNNPTTPEVARPALKLKKNEVFNPYLCSPVKKKVEAFEKHGNKNVSPDRNKLGLPKFSTLKAGTPSKIAVFGKTTPLSVNKVQKFTSTGTVFASGSSTSSSSKPLKPVKKVITSTKSLSSQESIDDVRKNMKLSQQQAEEKRKAREEKQRQAKLAREQMEKERRDLALKQQRAAEEKFQKQMLEKEEKMRQEALKKKLLKEKQEKKYAEERTKGKDEFASPKPPSELPIPQAIGLNESLHKKLQNKLLIDKANQQKKIEASHTYSFEMLNTDDSTDDESRPSQKRPPPPSWSKRHHRKQFIVMQSNVNSKVLDTLFSAQPISVDLRKIFPAIDPRKLIRNSSAVWRSPPRASQILK